jgi:hypothetical protein
VFVPRDAAPSCDPHIRAASPTLAPLRTALGNMHALGTTEPTDGSATPAYPADDSKYVCTPIYIIDFK